MTRVERYDAIVTVDGRRATTAVLIGADGANGVIGRAVVELGTVPGGYGWVFPQG